MKKNLILLLGVVVYASCANNSSRDIVYYEKSFAESRQISQDLQLPFCIILYDSLQNTPQEYLDKIHANKIRLNKGVFNFIDIAADKSKWYNKLLSPQTLPVTCIFSSSGELIDLIPGSSKESLLYTKEALTNQKANYEFHYNQKYGNNKLNIVSDINSILRLKFRVDNKENVLSELDTLLNKARYPYTLFLKLKNQLQFKDTVAAENTAKELLLFDSPRDLVDYYDEFMFARQVIDSTFCLETGPYIDVSPTEIELTDCKVNSAVPITINIKNKGQRPLKVSDVLMSCTCVKLVGEKKHLILPQQTETLNIEFIPDEPGEIFREVYIASNSVNSPISHVKINASVK